MTPFLGTGFVKGGDRVARGGLLMSDWSPKIGALKLEPSVASVTHFGVCSTHADMALLLVSWILDSGDPNHY